MLRILSIEDCKDAFTGYIEDGEVYRYYIVTRDEVLLPHEYPKSEYGDYLRFGAIMGKWDPEARFFLEPKEVSTFNYEVIKSIVKRMNETQGGENHDETEQ